MLKFKAGVLFLLFFIVSCSGSAIKTDTTMGKDTTQHKFTNSLITETSPYLLQHAHNPVNWMAWGDEAFEKAKKENKLVLISIGYSSCHWCHVMERESFEQEDVAELMNEHFVCIKVDREERPDVDQIYMDAVQLMNNGRGGWPLNCFTLPDGRPIYGGTYFAKEQWIEVLNNLQYNYEKTPHKFEEYATKLTEGIQQAGLVQLSSNGTTFSSEQLTEMVENWKGNLDLKHGGSKKSPKFPLPNNYDFLMQYAHHNRDEALMQQVDLTLEKMALGGIYDQIGGGFARYSTDEMWKVPHFEKMLYDNAQLVSLYANAFKRSKSPLYKKVVYQTIEWLKREMTTSEGSFYSALDADSEGEEGKFYVWDKAELESVLGSNYDFAKNYYAIDKNGAWEGNYILLRTETDEAFLEKNAMTKEALAKKVNEIETTLLKAREQRVRPGLDDKSLTSWNALMLVGLLDAYEAFNEKEFLSLAIKNAEWLVSSQLQKDGHLFHTYKNGQSTIPGFLEDYAFTIQAMTKLYENTFDEKYLNIADQLVAFTKTHFFDEKTGMFYFTSDEGSLIARKMEIHDNVIPATNSVMANQLYKLGVLLDRKQYKDMAKQMLANVIDDFPEYGGSLSNWGILTLNLTDVYYEVAITGKNTGNLRSGIQREYIPNKLILGAEKESDLILLEGKFLGDPTIFVCIEGACKLPTRTVQDALKQLSE
jgi:uncharacterized protein YyaL (SSP411 family)